MHNEYMTLAFEEAFCGIRNELGGPFGAVVVKDGVILGKGCNRVTSENDPTAHAEVTAIREACKTIGNFDLTGAEIYSTCEPCPMCLSAIYWSKITKVYYSLTQFDADDIGFSDSIIYQEFTLPPEKKTVKLVKLDHPGATELFDEWRKNPSKTLY
jgi:guanine deaminase